MSDFCFALFSDVQYADRPSRIGRFYRNAIRKTAACIDEWNHSRMDFCVHLGDLIDCPNAPEEGRAALKDMISVIDRCSHPVYFLLGNHDVDSVQPEEMRHALRLPGKTTWHSFDHKGVHFVLLDSNYDAEGRAYRPGTTRWNQCYLPDNELVWLREDLRQTQTDVVVILIHALLDAMDNPHVVINAAQVREILENCGKQVIVFQGHMHSGHESVTNGVGYHTLPAIVNGRTRIVWWLVQVTEERICLNVHDSLRKGKKDCQYVLLERSGGNKKGETTDG